MCVIYSRKETFARQAFDLNIFGQALTDTTRKLINSISFYEFNFNLSIVHVSKLINFKQY